MFSSNIFSFFYRISYLSTTKEVSEENRMELSPSTWVTLVTWKKSKQEEGKHTNFIIRNIQEKEINTAWAFILINHLVGFDCRKAANPPGCRSSCAWTQRTRWWGRSRWADRGCWIPCCQSCCWHRWQVGTTPGRFACCHVCTLHPDRRSQVLPHQTWKEQFR